MLSNLPVFLEHLAFNINTSKYVAGIMMILMNLGGRYISTEISDFQEEFMESPYVRRIFIFVVCFVATRDIKVSIILTLLFILLVSGIFNENSKYCILPVKTKSKKISKEEYFYAQSIVSRYEKQQIQKMKEKNNPHNPNNPYNPHNPENKNPLYHQPHFNSMNNASNDASTATPINTSTDILTDTIRQIGTSSSEPEKIYEKGDNTIHNLAL